MLVLELVLVSVAVLGPVPVLGPALASVSGSVLEPVLVPGSVLRVGASARVSVSVATIGVCNLKHLLKVDLQLGFAVLGYLHDDHDEDSWQ